MEDSMRVAVNNVLEAGERQSLKRLSRSRSTSVRLAARSTIVLLAAEGKTNGEIAEELGITRQRSLHSNECFLAEHVGAVLSGSVRATNSTRCFSQRA
jgi:hypothetical protein